MKKSLLLGLSLCAGVMGFSQVQRGHVAAELQNLAAPSLAATAESYNTLSNTVSPVTKSVLESTEAEIGGTRYDLWTNQATQNRLYRFADGTIGAVWTFGNANPNYADRGTGYNYYDGAAWGTAPDARIESVKTGWPSYGALGTNGEFVVSHGGDNLNISTRSEKGTGDWNYSTLTCPAGHELLWPRVVTSGDDHNTMHVIAVTSSEKGGGSVYKGLDGALLYYRSTDGGQTWSDDQVLPGLTSDDNYGFGGDMYATAEPRGNTVAFVVGDNWHDLALMKSTDNGETWNKTIIWRHPYQKWNNSVTDTIYAPDGTVSVAIDMAGKCHVAFGTGRVKGAEDGSSWFPFTGCVAYWNEGMDSWLEENVAIQRDVLRVDNLETSGNLIGYVPDIDGNGQIDYVGTELEVVAKYYSGAASMPYIHIDGSNNIFVTFTAMTEGFDNGTQQYRHIWANASADGGNTWGIGGDNEIKDLTNGFAHTYDECVFPTIASSSDENIYFIFNADDEPGLSVRGDEDPASDNRIIFQACPKADLLPSWGVKNNSVENVSVAQNFPNPVVANTQIAVNVNTSAQVSIEIVNMLGQVVYTQNAGVVKGNYNFNVNASQFDAGVYFYTVKAGENSVTKKMIVK